MGGTELELERVCVWLVVSKAGGFRGRAPEGCVAEAGENDCDDEGASLPLVGPIVGAEEWRGAVFKRSLSCGLSAMCAWGRCVCASDSEHSILMGGGGGAVCGSGGRERNGR